MRTDEEIMIKVFDEMCVNGTLAHSQNGFEVPQGISGEEVRSAFINRLSSELNEELQEPYGRARLKERSTDSIITDGIKRFYNLIIKMCNSLFISVPEEEETIATLRDNLDPRYV